MPVSIIIIFWRASNQYQWAEFRTAGLQRGTWHCRCPEKEVDLRTLQGGALVVGTLGGWRIQIHVSESEGGKGEGYDCGCLRKLMIGR